MNLEIGLKQPRKKRAEPTKEDKKKDRNEPKVPNHKTDCAADEQQKARDQTILNGIHERTGLCVPIAWPVIIGFACARRYTQKKSARCW